MKQPPDDLPVNGIADVKIIYEPELIEKHQSPKGKPFLWITWEDGTHTFMTLTIAEMIGATAIGVRKRLEDLRVLGDRGAAN